jgi:hypothetical protein
MEGTSKNRSSHQDVAPSTAVIEAIADYQGTDSMRLKEPLYEAIDPDALDALIANSEAGNGYSPTTVEFSYNGCRVRVSGDGAVEVSSTGTE